MFLRVNAGSAVLLAAATHASATELSALGTDGPFLTFDFGSDVTLESARESINQMDAYIRGAITDSDEPNEIAALSQLKVAVLQIERDVEREFIYMTRASAASEAKTDNAESQLHDEQHTAINDSSNSTDADLSNNEELNTNGTTQPKERNRNRKRS